MEPTADDLIKRIKELEEQILQMRIKEGRTLYQSKRLLAQRTPAEWGALAVSEAELKSEFYSQLWAQMLAVPEEAGKSIDREELFERYELAGFDPTSTAFGQGIVAMRDEA